MCAIAKSQLPRSYLNFLPVARASGDKNCRQQKQSSSHPSIHLHNSNHNCQDPSFRSHLPLGHKDLLLRQRKTCWRQTVQRVLKDKHLQRGIALVKI